jgi:hypothetical protein
MNLNVDTGKLDTRLSLEEYGFNMRLGSTGKPRRECLASANEMSATA